MGNYIVHFDDGSSAYLAHYGVKGMKWGVWNEETRRRHMGGGRLNRRQMSDSEKRQMTLARQTSKEFRKARESGDWEGKSVGVTNTVHARLKDAQQKMNDADPLGQKYYSDPQLQKRYKLKLADELAKKYDDTPSGRELYRRGVLYDDLDQGSMSYTTFERSYDLYVKDHVKDPNAYFNKQYRAQEEYKKAVKSEVDKLLGPYADAYTRINSNGTKSGKISDEVFYQSLHRASNERDRARNYYDPRKN